MSRPSGLTRVLPAAALLAVAYIPLLLTAPGVVVADTKSYLYLDPARLLSRAWSLWDPSIGTGTVTHQNIGYLWPMGPWYWMFDKLGFPDWVAQRLWLGTILAFAGFGVVWLLRTLGWRTGPEPWAAAFLYALTPYVLSVAARSSILLLPFAAMPWMIGIVARALRERTWRWPAVFALVVTTVGSVDLTALLLAGLGPALWVVWAVAAGEVKVRRAIAVVIRLGLLTVPISLWWLAGVWVQGRWGLDVPRYSETAKVVAEASTANEVLRGLGYWFFYGGDKLGPWIEPSHQYTQRLGLIALSYAIPIGALVAAGFTRWRHRGFFVVVFVVGVVVAVGAHPWDDPTLFGRGVESFLESEAGVAMGSLPRAAPLVVLALSIFAAGGLVALSRRFAGIRWPLVACVMAIAVMNLPPLWLRQMVPQNLRRDEDIPSYWEDAARALDARGSGTRVLEIPGSDFASYRWGTTVDAVLTGLMDRPTVARELIPFGTGPSADLLIALDHRLQERTLDPAALAAVARLLGAGDVVVRSDLQYERFNTPRPRNLWDLVAGAPGLGEPAMFGEPVANVAVPEATLFDELFLQTSASLVDPSPVAALPVDDALPTVRAHAAGPVLVVAGDGEGVVDAAEAGLLDGTELIVYSAGGLPVDEDAVLLLTDTNRRRGRRWTSVRHNTADTTEAGTAPMRTDLTVNDLPVFPAAAGDDTRTVAEHRGGVHAAATSFGNPITFTPEARAANAVDGDPTTAWRTAAFQNATSERLRLTFDDPVTTDHITLLQPTTGAIDRVLTKVRLHFDQGPDVDVDLDESSNREPGQRVAFDRRTFSRLEIEVLGDTSGNPPRFDGLTSVGFAEVKVGGVKLREVIRLPTDLLEALGDASDDKPLTLLVTRQRSDPTDATRSDEELSLVRSVTLPSVRDFTLSGQARLSAIAPDAVLDALVGTAVGGDVKASSSIRLNGDRTARGSSTIDGDTTTAWTTQFAKSVGEWVEYELSAPATVDHVGLTVVADGWHSVPTSVRVSADGRDIGTVAVPAIADDPERRLGATSTVELAIPPVTASTLRLTIEGVRAVETLNWNSGNPIAMPVAIAEATFGPTPITLPRPLEFVDTGCRDDLLRVDGRRVDLRITGDTASALRGGALHVALCDGGPVSLDRGEHLIEAAQGRATGLDLDRLVLRSAADRTGSGFTGTLVEEAAAVGDAAAPRVDVAKDERWRVRADVTGATPGEPFWFTLGQSFSDGWELSIDDPVAATSERSPQLVNGYANGWLVTPSSRSFSVTVTFTPQRTVNQALTISAGAAVLCLAVAFWPRRRPARVLAYPDAALEPAALSRGSWLVHEGASPSWGWSAGVAVGLAALFVTLAGPFVGVAVGVAALIAGRVGRARWLLTLGAPAALGVAAAYVLSMQARHHIAPGIEWPQELERAHPFGWLAVGLLVAEAAVAWLWSRRALKLDALGPAERGVVRRESVNRAKSRRRRPKHARRRRS